MYCPAGQPDAVRVGLGDRAEVIGVGAGSVDFPGMLADLAGRGIRRLMVEGGSTIHTQFLSQGLADELQRAIAPFFVGQADAPQWLDTETRS